MRLVGGKTVTGFRPVTGGGVLGKLEPAARGSVLWADLKALGIKDFGPLTQRGFGQPIRPAHMEFFYDDRPMTLARWPNEGYARIADLPAGSKARQFAYEGDRPGRWVNEPDLWVYGYWFHDWADTYLKVESVDAASKTITTVAQHGYGLKKGNRWHALNALSELDSPGEYYVDGQAGLLYFWPPGPPGPLKGARAIVSIGTSLIRLTGVQHVMIRGLILEACRGDAITIADGSHCQVVGCTIRNTGNRAVVVTGSDHAVIGCDIYDTGDGGISLSGGDRRTLTDGRLLAENNHIHGFSRWCHTYRPAVSVAGCGNVVRHNLIHHGPHNAIQLGGSEHRIEFNEIHSVCCDTGDVGAFYMGRDWTARGTVIRHNFFHHIHGPGQFGAMGVYLDDQASGIDIVGNVFWKVTRAAFIGGGCDNAVENNVFVDCAPAVHIDARGLGWQKKATDDPKDELRTRLAALRQAQGGPSLSRAAMPYQGDLWAKRYPTLPGILGDDPGTPKRNRIIRNICLGGQWESIDAKTQHFQTVEGNLVGQDPLFVDAAKGDFRLKPDSPALKAGFQPIPIDKIGLYEDSRRASWPVAHKPGELPQVPPGKTPRET